MKQTGRRRRRRRTSNERGSKIMMMLIEEYSKGMTTRFEEEEEQQQKRFVIGRKSERRLNFKEEGKHYSTTKTTSINIFLLLLLTITLSYATQSSCDQQREEAISAGSLPLLSPANLNGMLELGEGDLDNSIMTATTEHHNQQQQQQQADVSKKQTGIKISPAAISSDNKVNTNTKNNNNNQFDLEQSRLERRLDRLEFELRKSVHLMRANLVSGTTTTNNNNNNQQSQLWQQKSQFQLGEGPGGEGGGEGGSGGEGAGGEQLKGGVTLGDSNSWASLTSRLELMEKFLTTAATKLYETEQRVKQLEKCDCRLKCKWTPPSERIVSSSSLGRSNQSENNNNQTKPLKSIVKLDGQVWQSKCDICSCHRGNVRCKHVSCPELNNCSDPRHVAGKCCPVCFKPCVYKSQTVRHGNKLVINSNKDSCKECICMDGRLKCQRVEIELSAFTEPNNQGLTLIGRRQQRSIIMDLEYNSNRTQEGGHFLFGSESAEKENGLHSETTEGHPPSFLQSDSLSGESGSVDSYNIADGGGRPARRRRRNNNAAESSKQSAREQQQQLATLSPLLFCPQIDCKPEDQLQLKNDCCTYCKGFDFCAHKAKHYCHPNAFCINTLAYVADNLISQKEKQSEQQQQANTVDGNNTNTNSNQGLPTNSIDSMFSCHCKSGYRGNGRFCLDIDECSDRKLNNCDPKTTNCINLPGSYECQCKRGFRQQTIQQQQQQQQQLEEFRDEQQQQSSSVDSNELLNVTSILMQSGTPHTNQAANQAPSGSSLPEMKVKNLNKISCLDLNECSDGKLNRCHQQAKCINRRGSYKCACKHGFLGNGFECHKWFSSDPSVAAYLYRHQAKAKAAAAASDTFKQTKSDGTNSNATLSLGSENRSGNSGSSGSISIGSSSSSGGGNRYGSEATIYEPLYSLDDSDDDHSDSTTNRFPKMNSNDYDEAHEEADADEDNDDDDELDDEDGEANSYDGNNNSNSNNDTISGNNIPKLSESKWEPLHFDWSTNFQQHDQIVGSNQAESAASGQTGSGKTKQDAQQQQSSSSSMSLNTRTMFFQPPPPPKVWQTTNYASANKTLIEQQQTNSDSSAGNGGGKSDIIQSSNIINPAYIQRLATESVYQEQTTSLPETGPKEGQQQQQLNKIYNNNNNGKSKQSVTNNNSLQNNQANNGQQQAGGAYKKGTIIASATTTTQLKGYNRQGHPSPYQRIKSTSISSSASSTKFKSNSLVTILLSYGNDWTNYNYFSKITTTLRLEQILYIATFLLISMVNHVVTIYFI